MQSNSSTPESNKGGWTIMTELTAEGCAAPSNDDKTASSPGSSSLGPQTPPTGTATRQLFGANKPVEMVFCPGHYTLSPSTYPTNNSPTQYIPRALASSGFTALNYQQSFYSEFQSTPGSNATAWLPACNGCIKRSCQEGLGDPPDLIIDKQERKKTQFEPSATKFKSKKAKGQENQEEKTENQETNDQQNNLTSKLENRQHETEQDDESISDFELDD